MVNWGQIDTVLLDMDGTLLDLHFDNFFWLHHLPRRYAEQRNVHVDQVIAGLYQRMQAKQGTLDWYCTDFWSREFDLDIIQLKNEIGHLIDERPLARVFLETLGRCNKRRILVTNAHRNSVDIKFARTGIDTLLDLVVSSHDYGTPKEDQQFWHKLQTATRFDPARTLFIVDSEAILESAHQFGIAHVLGIEKPDSQKEARVSQGFTMLNSFAQILDLEQPQ